MIPTICAWCFDRGQLVILNEATWEQAMDALAELTLSHGVCEPCAEKIRETNRLRKAVQR